MHRLSLAVFALMLSVPASAATLGMVDFTVAVSQTNQGKAAQARIDTMLESRRAEIEKMGAELEAQMKGLEQRAIILSEDARRQEEQVLLQKQAQYQQTAMQYEAEMGQTYQMLLADLDGKLRAMSKTIAKEKGIDMLVDANAVVFNSSEVVDITSELVERYDAVHK